MKKRKLSLDRETITASYAAQLGVDGGTDESYACDPQPVLRGTQTLKYNCYEVSIALCSAFCYSDLCTVAGC